MGWEYKPLPYLLATTNLILHDMEVPNIRFGDALDQPLSNFTEKHRVNAILANPPFGGIVANNNENNFPQIIELKKVPICSDFNDTFIKTRRSCWYCFA